MLFQFDGYNHSHPLELQPSSLLFSSLLFLMRLLIGSQRRGRILYFDHIVSSLWTYEFFYFFPVCSGLQKSVTAPLEAEDTVWAYFPRTPRE